ncbi:MAG: efflux transporter outer membrane subunit [Saprospiraceae bacterium]
MKRIKHISYIGIIAIYIVHTGCKVPGIIQTGDVNRAPVAYTNSTDTSNSAAINWKEFFNDKNLVALIDTALHNNLDVLMTMQEIEIAKNNILMREGLLHPRVSAGGGLGIDKVGRYTSTGAGDASTEITPGKIVPEHLTDISLGFQASWEADIWGKLRNAKKAAFVKYLATTEGKNFVVTNLVAEIANSYYELLSLDNKLEIIRQTIQLQQNQLEIVKIQKQASMVTELALKQFEAQVYKAQALEYEVLQQITEVENRINFLLSRYPQKISRDTASLTTLIPNRMNAGIPSQLLKNRPDIKQAELELQVAKLDVKTAQLEFYPSLDITSTLGIQAFKPGYLFRMPESLVYSLLGDLAGPVVNRRGIMAEFKTANALQISAMYNYQKSILTGFVEVSTELSNISNIEKVYALKSKEADVLLSSVDISNDLFKSARANYLEVLTAQRDALSTKLELVDVKERQFNAVINLYKSLGGGWR